MGYTTDFIGHIDVVPPLNASEQQYLTAFSESRRCLRSGGPYDVPGNPAVERMGEPETGIDAINQVADGQPELWCDWVPCWNGGCFTHNGREKSYAPTAWMRYLIAHFVAPGAEASRSELSWFDGFTFDHEANGIIAGCRRHSKELFLISVEHNEVTEQVLRPGDPDLSWRELLANERFKDNERASRRRRPPRRKTALGNVIDLYDD